MSFAKPLICELSLYLMPVGLQLQRRCVGVILGVVVMVAVYLNVLAYFSSEVNIAEGFVSVRGGDQHRCVVYWLEIMGGNDEARYTVLFKVPDNTSYQRVVREYITVYDQDNKPKECTKHEFVDAGNRYIQVTFSNRGNTRVKYSAEVKIAAGVSKLKYGEYSVEYLEVEPSEALYKLLNELKGPTKLQTIRNIHSWVRDNVVYVASLEPRKPVDEVISSRTGDCDDKSAAEVALLRLAGIPARVVVGLVGEGANNHAWVEIYLNGYWIPADPSSSQLGVGEILSNTVRIYHETTQIHQLYRRIAGNFYSYAECGPYATLFWQGTRPLVVWQAVLI